MTTVASPALDRFTNAIGSVPIRWVGQELVTLCPAHDDHRPSLSVRPIEGQLLVHCHAGCETTTVLAALGLQLADLYDDRAGVTYEYDDGRRVHRTPTKRFSQTGNRSGTATLYRRDRVLAAVSRGEPIYLVEGEKDVHTLESAGVVATTSPMGAGSWSKVDPSPLSGGDIVVIADADDPGRRYAAHVRETLTGLAARVRVVEAKAGKDVSDHLIAGYSLDELVPVDLPSTHPPTGRRVTLTRASDIQVRPVHWLWRGRIAAGTLALIAGREGVGKSTAAYTLAAEITRGRLPGRHQGETRAVIVAASEDSWEHTIVPRLMAVGADLDQVYRVDVETADGIDTDLSLPRDLRALEEQVTLTQAALILLDPLMSRLDAALDTHKDADVRRALEPLVSLANRTGAAVLGLIHLSKAHSTDPLTVVMGSRAFAAVARSVLFVMADPDDEGLRLLGQPKNNLGRADLPTLTFRIESAKVADSPEGPIITGRLVWGEERQQSIRDALEASGADPDVRSATTEAGDWLVDHLMSRGGTDDSASIKSAARGAGHAEATLKRAWRKLAGTTETSGFPRRSYWTLPSRLTGGESGPTDLTDPTEPTAVGSAGSPGSIGSVPPREDEPAA